jgi:hypothetical protein
MKRQRDLHAVIARIQAMLAQDGLEPEQKNALVKALKALKLIRRKANPTKQDFYLVVRQIAEDLFTAFMK